MSVTPLLVLIVLLAMVFHYMRQSYTRDTTNIKGGVADTLLGGISGGSMGQELQEYSYRESRRNNQSRKTDKDGKKKKSSKPKKMEEKDDDKFDKV